MIIFDGRARKMMIFLWIAAALAALRVIFWIADMIVERA